MFAQSFVASSGKDRNRRGWTTLASFGLQALGVAALILFPILYTQGLPSILLLARAVLQPPPAPPPRPSAPSHPRAIRTVSSFRNGALMQPSSIPSHMMRIQEDVAPPQIGMAGIPGGTGDHWASNSVLNSIGSGAGIALPPPPPVVVPPRPTSRMMEGNLVHRVQPQYPAMARAARVQGTVVLRAIISKEGTIENLTVLSGHPLLVKAAIDAVTQWRYRPYYLNNQPVEVETQVTVNFILSGG